MNPDFSDNSESEILSLLIELAEMLLRNNPKAESCLNLIKAHSDGLGIEQEIIHLEDQIDRFDFKGARKTLSEIEKTMGISLNLRKR